ncbi:hypothetical protein, partial [Methylomonas lenta]|uniref:hypothetical protein n=1 Tax=Methylomonas lenta TaxID=980561 RepID=UPI000AD90ACC
NLMAVTLTAVNGELDSNLAIDLCCPEVSHRSRIYLVVIVLMMPNVELTGAARLYRAASSDQRERG